MFGMPQQTPFDLRFTLFRIPVSVGPFFWLVALIFCSDKDGKRVAIGVFAFFLAILVHELGHALVIRYIFGASPWVVLHGFGGLTFHQSPYYYRTPRYAGRILISFAGPMAGFLLSFLCYFLLRQFAENLGDYLGFLLFLLYNVGIFWGVINLLPVYPLDGGQICREICQWISPRRGVRVSLYISAVTGIASAVLSLMLFKGSIFLPLFFGLLGYQSIQMLQTRRY